ncbi:MAG: cytochrome C [Gammaproteobacteria bacterium]
MRLYNCLLLLSATVVMTMTGCASNPTPLPDAQSSSARLYETKCSACHSIPHPKRHTFSQWQVMLDLMEQRMVEKGLPSLSDTERKQIVSYLKENAR